MPRASVAGMPRNGGRPNKDRVMVSFYVERSTKTAIEALAAEDGQLLADHYRAALLAYVAPKDAPRPPPGPGGTRQPSVRVFGGGS